MAKTTSVVKNTGWCYPNQVSQFAEFGKVNKSSCYAFANLDRIKKEDGLCAYIPSNGGVNETHNSPRVYCYDFKFHIPADAHITKILVKQRRKKGNVGTNTKIKDWLIKLKVGANVSEWGVGNDLSKGMEWNSKNAGLSDYIAGENYDTVQATWGVEVTPAMANNQNFGCIVQCTGTGKPFDTPEIDSVGMCIYYKIPSSETDNDAEGSSVQQGRKQSENIFSKLVKEYQPDDTEVLQTTVTSISEDYCYTPFIIWLQYRSRVNSETGIINQGYNDEIRLWCESSLRFSNGTNKMVFPMYNFEEITDKDDLRRGYVTRYTWIKVYPVSYDPEAKVKAYGVHYSENGEIKREQEIILHVSESIFNLSSSTTELNKCTFNDCSAVKGNSIYNAGSLTFTNLKFNTLPTTDKEFWDYDKYRDGEFR